MIVDVRTLSRRVTMYLLFFLPTERKVRIERWLRGREDCRKLALADCVVVSFGKSGRTWLRVMLSRFYQVRFGLSQGHLLAFDNLHAKNSAIPRILFTHDNYLKDYNKNCNKSAYYDKKAILLVRAPADVAVSQYYQWKYRMKFHKRQINDYPMDDGITLFEFVIREESGLPKIIEFMNEWGRELDRMKCLMVVRYEDLRANPEEMLRRIIEFVGTPGSSEQISVAVRFASVENMRKLEERRVFWLSGPRMAATDRKNPNTFKVRRAKVGGYRDDFTPEQLDTIDALVKQRLHPVFDYQRSTQAIAQL